MGSGSRGEWDQALPVDTALPITYSPHTSQVHRSGTLLVRLAWGDSSSQSSCTSCTWEGPVHKTRGYRQWAL